MSSTNSVEQHVYLKPGEKPEKLQSYATKTNRKLAEEEQIRDVFKHKRVELGHGVTKAKVGTKGDPNILRTIHMPNDQATQAESESARLTAQIEKTRLE